MMKNMYRGCAIFLVFFFLFILVSCNENDAKNSAEKCLHEFSNWEASKDATCVETGLDSRTCRKCGETETKPIPALGHTLVQDDAVKETCSTEGLTEGKHCLICGEVIIAQEVIPATGKHNYTIKVTTQATCTKEGVKTFTCSVCKNSYTEKIAATGIHNYVGKVTTEATCAKDGVKTFTCSLCKKTYTEKIAATGMHNYTGQITAQATCTRDGIKTFTCSTCGDSYTEKIAGGHKWIEATCIAPRTCSVCNLIEGNPLGHTTNNGTCSRCNTVVLKPLVFSGNGDKIITHLNLNGGLYKVSLTHNGKRNFIVVPYDGDGERKSSLVNKIGVYSGSTIFNDSLNNGYLEITADGYWTVTIETIQTYGTSNIKGSGDCVSPFFELPRGAHVVSLNYSGKSNFIVVVYDNTGKRYSSLANKIGNYSGEVIFNEGDQNKLYCIEVIASGNWSVDFGLTSKVTTCSF